MTSDNAADVMTVGASIIESGAQIALAAINPIVELLNSGNLQLSRACGGGTLTATITDNDGDGALSDGDLASVQYGGACFSGELGDEATGTIQFDVNEIETGVGNSILVRGALTFPASFSVGQIDTVDVSGTLNVTAIVQSGFELLQLDIPSGGRFSLAINASGVSTTESASALNLRRFVEPSTGAGPTYVLSATATINSGLLGGNIDCATTTELSSTDLNEEPVSGQLDCTGLANSTARLDSNRASSATAIDLLVDPEGDGTFASVGNLPSGPPRWTNFLEGALFGARIRTVRLPSPPGLPQLTSLPLSFSAKQIIYAPIRNRLVATTATSIVEIDPTTMAVVQSVAVAGSPGALALSDDETTLWVALDDLSEIQRFNYPALAAGNSFPLGDSSISAGTPRDVFQMEVAPGTTDIVVLSTSSLEEMVAYDNGTELPNLVNSPIVGGTPPRSFAFRDATNIVGVDDTSTAYSVYRVTLDPATGLTVTRTLPGLSAQLRGRLKIGTDDVFATGRVFNELTESVEAEIEPADALGFFYSDIQVDATANRIYGIAGGQLDVYDETTFAHIGRYSAPGGSSNTILTPDYLVFVTPTTLERYELSEIQPNLATEPCRRTDLSDIWVDGTYVQLACDIREATYDPARNRIYAALPNVTERGNSVVVIDPDDLTITSFVPVGGTPKSLRISRDGATLFAILDETSKIVEIDLDSLMVTDTTILGFDLTQPYLGVDLAPTTETGGEAVVVLNSRIGLIGAGTTIGTISPFSGQSWDQIFVTTAGSTAVARGFNSVGVFGVSTSGVSPLSTQNGVAFPRRAEQRGDFFYEGRGTRFNLATQSFETICSVPPIAAQFDIRVGPDLGSDLVYFGAIGLNGSRPSGQTFELVACDPTTQAVGPVKSEFVYTVLEGDVLQLLPVSSNRIAVLTTTHMVLMDRPMP